MKELVGKWKLDWDRNDNFEEYLKAVGIPMLFRKLGKQVVPTEEITQVDDNTWSLYVVASVRHSRLHFRFGEEIHETTMDGRKCVSRFEVDEEGVLVQYQKSLNPGVPDTKITRKRSSSNLFIQEYEAVGTNVKSVRKFVRQEG
ncbi:FABP1-like protein [Mya arenaria]|uniref:FABP1-like protein n=1 Tax=Mya arenaria TaxID=6604 RepID=A0ABY7EXZ1_MYAAR|nr:sodium/calcium exchanger regulatory protein 1-like [Mya arenaria]WAR13294.1 FABP1-like protein [Mya arenaria]